MNNITKLDIINSNPPTILVNGEAVEMPFPHYGTTIDIIMTALEATDTTVVAEEFETFEVDDDYIRWDFSDNSLDNDQSVLYS